MKRVHQPAGSGHMVGMTTPVHTHTIAGTTALRGLDLFRSGDLAGARTAAQQARLEAETTFAAQLVDGLAYAAVCEKGPRAAETSVRRFLVALDDPRYLTLPAAPVEPRP